MSDAVDVEVSADGIEVINGEIYIPGGRTSRLLTAGKYCPEDIKVYAKPIYIDGDEAKEYAGAYEVTPSLSETVLETSGLVATDNIVIKPIPYVEVENDAGGTTVTIG